ASLIPCSRQMSATLVPPSACRNARRICSSECPFFATFVSSSFSSRGPRLPLQTQLIHGSLFGFWLNFGRFCRFAPTKALSGSARDRESRAHAPILRDSLRRLKP